MGQQNGSGGWKCLSPRLKSWVWSLGPTRWKERTDWCRLSSDFHVFVTCIPMHTQTPTHTQTQTHADAHTVYRQELPWWEEGSQYHFIFCCWELIPVCHICQANTVPLSHILRQFGQKKFLTLKTELDPFSRHLIYLRALKHILHIYQSFLKGKSFFYSNTLGKGKSMGKGKQNKNKRIRSPAWGVRTGSLLMPWPQEHSSLPSAGF